MGAFLAACMSNDSPRSAVRHATTARGEPRARPMRPMESRSYMSVSVGPNHMEKLPDELLLELLRKLSHKDLASISRCSHRFRSLVEDNLLWKDKCGHNFNLIRTDSKLTLDEVLAWKPGFVDPQSLSDMTPQGDPSEEEEQTKEQDEAPKASDGEKPLVQKPDEPSEAKKEEEQEKKEEPKPAVPVEWGAIYWKQVYKAMNEVKWDGARMDNGMLLANQGTTAHHPNMSYASVQCKKVLSKGVHVFSIAVDAVGGGVGFGVCPLNTIKSRFYVNPWSGDVSTCGYSYFSNGCKYNKGSFYSQKYETYGVGDTITMYIDMDKRTVEFFKNNKALGIVFSDLPEQAVVAVSLSKAQVSLLPSDFLKLKP